MSKTRKEGDKLSIDLKKWKEYLNGLSSKGEFGRWYKVYCHELDEGNLPPPAPPSLFLPEKSKRKGPRKKLPDPRITREPDPFYRDDIIKDAKELLANPERFLYILKRRREIFMIDPIFGFAIRILSYISDIGGREATPANRLLDSARLSHFKFPFPKGTILQHEGLWYYDKSPDKLKESVKNYKVELLSLFTECAKKHKPKEKDFVFKTGGMKVYNCCLEHAIKREFNEDASWKTFSSVRDYQKDITHTTLLYLAHKECEGKFTALRKIYRRSRQRINTQAI